MTSTMTSPDAETHACPDCGGPVEWPPGMRTQTCPFCAKVIELDAAIAAELAHRSETADADLSAELRARWEGVFYRRQGAAAAPVVVGVTAVSTLLTGWFLMLIAGEVTLLVQLPSALLTVALVEWSTRGWIAAFAMPTLAELAAHRIVRCGKCGATAHVKGGATADQCTFCRSSLLSPAHLAADLLDELAGARAETTAETARGWTDATAAGDRLVTPATVGVLLAAFILFPAAFAVAWRYADIAPFHAGWLSTLIALYLIASGARWARTLTRTVAARKTMEAQVDERVRRLAHRRARPIFDASLAGRDAEGTLWVSDGALIIRAAFIDLPNAARKNLSPDQIDNVWGAADGAFRSNLAQWQRQDVGDYRHPEGVRLGHGYVTLLREIERSAGSLELIIGGPRTPIIVDVGGTRIGVVMPTVIPT